MATDTVKLRSRNAENRVKGIKYTEFSAVIPQEMVAELGWKKGDNLHCTVQDKGGRRYLFVEMVE